MKNNIQRLTIGLPKALLYHKYGVFWKTFFEELKCNVIVSPETNREILNRGLNLAVDESCLSIKLFLGHVDWLCEKRVDYVFIPHIVSVHRKEETCVKIMGLYDITRNTFSGINLLEYTVDANSLKTGFFGYLRAGLRITESVILPIKAYLKARRAQKKYQKELINKQSETVINRKEGEPTILVVSHPYTTYDGLLGKPVIDFLKSQDVNVLYSDAVDYKHTRKLSCRISSDLYWTYNKELLGAIEYYKDIVDGIIFLMTFPCGPDSLVINLCQNKLEVPMSLLVLDELQGEAGLRTRLESFVDILRLKKRKEK